MSKKPDLKVVPFKPRSKDDGGGELPPVADQFEEAVNNARQVIEQTAKEGFVLQGAVVIVALRNDKERVQMAVPIVTLMDYFTTLGVIASANDEILLSTEEEI